MRQAFLVFSMLMCLPFWKCGAVEPVGMLDMRYLLTRNLSDTASVKQIWDELHAVATLQGIVNKKEPVLYIKYVVEGNICIDEYWWNKYRQPGKWLANRDTFLLQSIEEAIAFYRKRINGVVVYDPKVHSTSNVASSIAGIENLMALRYDTDPLSLYSRVVLHGPKLPVKVWLVNRDGTSKFTGEGKIADTGLTSGGSLKNDPYLWFIEKYMKTGKCSGEYGAYYIDQKWMENPGASVSNHHTLSNHDFFVSRKAFFFE